MGVLCVLCDSALHRVSVPPVALLLQQHGQWWPFLQLCLLAAVVVVEDVDAVVDAALAPLAHSQLLCAPLAHSHHVCAPLAHSHLPCAPLACSQLPCAPLAHSQLPCAALVQHQLAEDADAADRMRILCLDITRIQ